MSMLQRPLRASFVVTLAAIASMAGAGCADTVGPGATSADAEPLSCPTALPVDGTACPANAPFNCVWGGCHINGGLNYRTGGCADGTWHIFISSCGPVRTDAGAD